MYLRTKLSLEKSFASHDKSQYWSDKNELKPKEVALNSNKKFYFNCECGHELYIKPNTIVSSNTWCAYCARKKLCDDNDCNMCYNNSFASHEKAKYWSEKNDIKPRNISKYNKKKCKFNCFKCNHIFESTLADVANGSWCGYCHGIILCDDSKCNTCLTRSFAINPKSKYWSSKNLISPRDITNFSQKKFIFNCNCGHEFEASPASVSANNWCPYCSNQAKALCDKDDCKKCFERSFASSDKSKYWHQDNKLMPRQVALNARAKYKFKCQQGHIFESKLHRPKRKMRLF
jgi:hypothetical protein